MTAKAKQLPGIHCIQRVNPFSGFISSHTAICSRSNGDGPCGATATHHITIGISSERPNGYYCSNVCQKCGEKLSKRGQLVVGVYVLE